MIVVCLIKEDIFAVFALDVGCVLFKDTFLVDTVFLAQLFPEFGADWIRIVLLWFPHWPMEMVIIYLGIAEFNLNWFSNIWCNILSPQSIYHLNSFYKFFILFQSHLISFSKSKRKKKEQQNCRTCSQIIRIDNTILLGFFRCRYCIPLFSSIFSAIFLWLV